MSSTLVPARVRLPLMVVKPGLAPIRSVPLLVSVPVPRLMEPALCRMPLLMNDALDWRVKLLPAATRRVPALAANPADEVSVPAWTITDPEFTKLVTEIVEDPVSDIVPKFTTLAALLS